MKLYGNLDMLHDNLTELVNSNIKDKEWLNLMLLNLCDGYNKAY